MGVTAKLTSCSNPSSWMTPDVRDKIFSSYPFAARLHCAAPMLELSRVNVSPPPMGRQPRPLSASLHFPGCFDRSR